MLAKLKVCGFLVILVLLWGSNAPLLLAAEEEGASKIPTVKELVEWKYIGRDDDRWLYISDIDLVKRIPPVDERAPYMGTTFCTEDTSGRDFELDNHELVEVTDTQYVVKSTPKDPDTVKFAYFKTWLNRDPFHLVKIEYYDENDEPYRRWDALSVEVKADGFTYYIKVRMRDSRMKRETVVVLSKIEFNTGLNEQMFVEQFMRIPPEEAFQ